MIVQKHIMQKQMSEAEKQYYYILPDGFGVYCDRPDKINFKTTMDLFYEMFSKFLNKEMWAMDIGASCGDSTVVMAACLREFPSSRILVFEPSKEIYDNLYHNISMNPIVTYDIHTVAAGEKNELVDFVYATDNGGLIIPDLLPERGPCIPSYKAQVVNTYQYLRATYKLEDLDKIQFIKIDTEGYDYIILRNLAPLIYRNRMPLIVEWWNDPNNSNLMFDEIEKLYYEPFNSRGESVNRFDFNTPKRTNDLFLYPIS